MSCTSLNLYWNDAVVHACAATGSIDLLGGGGGVMPQTHLTLLKRSFI